MKQEPSLVTSFALGEIEPSQSGHFDSAAHMEVEEIRKAARLIERALAEEPMPISGAPSRKKTWLIGAASAAAAVLMVVALPHKNSYESVSVVEDAFAESFSAGLDKEAIRQVVRSHLGEIKKCYEDQLPTDPSLSGKLLVRFTLSEAGVVSEALVKKSTLSSVLVPSCVVERVKTWGFPAGPNGVVGVVEYPFEFSSK